MNIVNRGFIHVKAKQAFIDWANSQDEEEFFMDTFLEGNVYLIEEDFFDIEPVLEANFKKIFLNELQSVSDHEENYPAINMENFEAWFECEVGNAVFDCEKSNLKAD